MRVMPVTVGTVTMRCPALTTSVTVLPTPSRAPGSGDWSITVSFGAMSLFVTVHVFVSPMAIVPVQSAEYVSA